MSTLFNNNLYYGEELFDLHTVNTIERADFTARATYRHLVVIVTTK